MAAGAVFIGDSSERLDRPGPRLRVKLAFSAAHLPSEEPEESASFRVASRN
jgi:hypothetical protein